MEEERSPPVLQAKLPPYRHELLSMVRKHSTILNKATFDEEDVSDVEMDSLFWHDMMDSFFIRGKRSKGRQDDDLIFFVKNIKSHGIGFNNSMGGAPYFVRRWAPKLDIVVGEESIDVDWRRSFYLNLITHTSFTVTVAICSVKALRRHQNGAETVLSSIFKVVKTVYASPSCVDFQLDSKKVLTEQDHSYCLLLNANGGAAFPYNEPTKADSEGMKFNEITVFSGLVSYKMIREAYNAGRSRFGSLLSVSHYPTKADRLIMRGPGGCGEVEVAVSGVVDHSLDSGPSTPIQLSRKGFGIGLGTFVCKAASAASVAARHAYALTRRSEDEHLPLKCCLMSISLPWEQIAHDLLFKISFLKVQETVGVSLLLIIYLVHTRAFYYFIHPLPLIFPSFMVTLLSFLENSLCVFNSVPGVNFPHSSPGYLCLTTSNLLIASYRILHLIISSLELSLYMQNASILFTLRMLMVVICLLAQRTPPISFVSIISL